MKSAPDRAIILCADDFGIAPGVNAAILDLLRKQRLSAVSCMTLFPEFARDGHELAGHAAHASLGVHLTLTNDRTLGALLRAAYLHTLDLAAVAREIDAQIERFTEIMGRKPDFLDGHQHVHVLPGVRDLVIEHAARLRVPVRILNISPAKLAALPSRAKALGLSLMGAVLAREVARRGLAANSEFRGVRSFAETEPYRALFLRMIEGAADGCLIMCHPGLPDAILAARDELTTPREDEYNYLASEDFVADLASARTRLSPVQAVPAQR